ncbi:type II secretion system F family protein [Lacrimispora saccharolytica]|uniref:type II secretion system F family protein n=1 Tax=Lacrimispora saccharolytica TaxID=84030 RepID=UPI00265D4F57|nr:type II secretion system F family protein [Lacrimispora saccharolytica]MCF2656278.1 type II secretion system F family protein [Lacrimispora saccharolytica]
MASYGYEALDKSGKVIKGSIDADSVDQAKVLIKKQGYVPTSIKEQSLMTKDINIQIGGKVTPRDMSVFCRQFVSMNKAGVSILECLKLLAEQTENAILQKAIGAVRSDVEKGEALATALAKHPKVFPNLMVTIVAAGEASGSLDVSLERMADQFEKSAKTKALVKKAMIYPAMVAIVAVIVVIVMLVWVIPNYMEMFDSLGTDLPAITKAVIAMSEFIQNYWMILIPVIIAIVIALRAFFKTPAGQEVKSTAALKFPAMKNLVQKSACSSLARTLSTLLSAGVPLVEAVAITAKTMDNVLYRRALENTKDEVIKGVPLSEPLEECGLFPPMLYHMIRIGEESGSTEEMLTKLADYYDEEVEMATQSLMAAMEPLIILVLAAVVGVLIGAIMAPMLKMYQAMDSL